MVMTGRCEDSHNNIPIDSTIGRNDPTLYLMWLSQDIHEQVTKSMQGNRAMTVTSVPWALIWLEKNRRIVIFCMKFRYKMVAHTSKVLCTCFSAAFLDQTPKIRSIYWETVKISWFGQKEWLEICAIFFTYGVEEMMRNASCFIIYIPCE